MFIQMKQDRITNTTYDDKITMLKLNVKNNLFKLFI